MTITQAKQYQPASITVAPGALVTFKVTNPGQTKQLTWKFPDKEGATVIYGSHSPGGYAAGMKGMITVSG